MQIGYSSYALKMVDVFDAVPRIREIGYDAFEVCARDGWQTEAARFDSNSRKKLASVIREQGFPSPVLVDGIDICAPEGEREAMFKRATDTFQLARDLMFDDTTPIISTTAGPSLPEWESGKEYTKDAFLRFGDLAAESGVIIAVEPHADTEFETPEKAAWMMNETRHPNLKLDYDISHFHVEGSTIARSTELCAPDTAMIHVKDGYKQHGRTRFQLTGAGSLDLAEFLGSVKDAGLQMPIFVEVSQQQSGQTDYDPWWTAEFCFDALDRARSEVAAR